jgi:hypothetical protein
MLIFCSRLDRGADPHHFSSRAYPDPFLYLIEDPDPDPTIYFNADLDPGSLQSVATLRPLAYRPSGALL